MGYALSPTALTIGARLSFSNRSIDDLAAAVIVSMFASMYRPLRFLTLPYSTRFRAAYACSPYPIAPGEFRTSPITPTHPLPPIPVGHVTDFPNPTRVFHSLLTDDK